MNKYWAENKPKKQTCVNSLEMVKKEERKRWANAEGGNILVTMVLGGRMVTSGQIIYEKVECRCSRVAVVVCFCKLSLFTLLSLLSLLFFHPWGVWGCGYPLLLVRCHCNFSENSVQKLFMRRIQLNPSVFEDWHVVHQSHPISFYFYLLYN